MTFNPHLFEKVYLISLGHILRLNKSKKYTTIWWFQPLSKIWVSKWAPSSPKFGGENDKKIFELPPPRRNTPVPIVSMYDIFTYIWLIFMVFMYVNIPYMDPMGFGFHPFDPTLNDPTYPPPATNSSDSSEESSTPRLRRPNPMGWISESLSNSGGGGSTWMLPLEVRK